MKTISRTAVFLLLLLANMMLFLPEVVSACPGCNSISTGSVGRGFNTSIFFMMAMPFVIAGTVIGGIIIYRRNHGEVLQTGIENDSSST